MSTPLLRPLGIGESLDVAIKIYMRNAGALFRLVLIVVAPVQLVSVLIEASTSTSQDVFDPASGTVDAGDVWTWIAGVGVVFVLALISTTLASGVCFKVIADAYLGAKGDWRAALGFVARRLHSILWVTVLGAILAGIGVVLCVIPGVYLWVSFVVAVPVLLTERLKGRKALGRSRALVRGRWWSVFAIVLIGTLLKALVSGALAGLASAVSLSSDDPASVPTLVVSFLTGTLSSTVTTPFTAAIAVVIYVDLRVRKEAFDLQLLAGQLGVDPPEGTTAAYAPLLPAGPPAGSQPPFWPPPPGWTPGPGASEPGPASEPPDPAADAPPFWPPPGWTPGGGSPPPESKE